MRILCCNYEYPPLGGGGGVVMAAMARQLARRHEVTVLTSGMPGLPVQSDDAGVRVIRVPVLFRRELATANFPSMAAYLPMGFWRGLQLGRRGGFDVINTHFVVPTGPLGSALASTFGIPNILSVHGGDLYDPSKTSSPHRHALLRRAVSRLLRRADMVVAQSRDTAGNVRTLYGVDRAVELIPLGIDRPPATENVSRTEFDLPSGAFVMVSAGRLVARKATSQLIELLRAVPDAFLMLIGDGPEAEALQRQAHELGVHDRLRMLGFVPEERKYRALAAADLFVSTSQHEGFGLVFLEAMAFGLPIVCYNRGGQTDFLTTPHTGHVVPLNDFTGFTAAVIELRTSPERRELIRRHSRTLVERYFIDRCAESYERLFEQAVLAGHGRRASRERS
ncbi:MAG TPA: glycosyltransferase [Steroidobacteraceae bacterium]|nr:glycosyltransferase [Steroidobacteraceae bacterium]